MPSASYIAIDYSMTSPAVCVYRGPAADFHFSKCQIHFMSDRRKFFGCQTKFPNLHCTESIPSGLYKNPIQRYLKIAEWVDSIILCPNAPIVIEDYSMGSKGKLFHIAENTAILKHMLYQRNLEFVTIPPTVLKKFATGKGNSNKNKMYEAFLTKENGPDLLGPFSESRVSSPISDIVDAYFFCKYALSVYPPSLT